MSAREQFDLLARARRQRLTSTEEQELSLLLREDVAARCLLEAGLEADRAAASSSDDAAWITRMARTAELASMRSRSARSEPSRRPEVGRLGRALRATPVLAATVCFACGALAGVGAIAIHSALTPSATTPASAVRDSSVNKASERSLQPGAVRTPPAPSGSTKSDTSTAPSVGSFPPAIAAEREAKSATLPQRSQPNHDKRVELPVLAPSDEPPVPAPVAPALPADAAELYRRGNRARQESRIADAIATYRELQATHPTSEEAVASHLTLGNLLLLQGDATTALAQFRAHRAAGGGGFERESLWGEATALRKLGRFAEERAVLSELVTRYPNSAYELPARRRLQSSD